MARKSLQSWYHVHLYVCCDRWPRVIRAPGARCLPRSWEEAVGIHMKLCPPGRAGLGICEFHLICWELPVIAGVV